MLWKRNQPSLPTGFTGPMMAIALAHEPPAPPAVPLSKPVSLELAPPAVPLSKPVSLELLDDEYAEYKGLLRRIGIVDCQDIVDEEMKRCLLENNIECYNLDDVHVYLDKVLENWHWRGLRLKDAKEMGGSHYVLNRSEYYFAYEVYTAAIPLPVLHTVATIQDAIPEMCFYVSQKGMRRPLGDPFLLCTCKKSSKFIVERWDEPGFRQGTK